VSYAVRAWYSVVADADRGGGPEAARRWVSTAAVPSRSSVPAFCSLPRSADDIVNHTVSRVLDLFGTGTGQLTSWTGPPRSRVPYVVEGNVRDLSSW